MIQFLKTERPMGGDQYGLAGMEAIKNNTQVFQTVKQGFALEDVAYFQLSAGTGIATNSGFATENKF